MEPLYYRLARRVLGPIYRQRTLLEKVQYWGRPIADGQSGHDVVRSVVASGVGCIGKIGESELRGLRCYLRGADASGHCTEWDAPSQRLYTNAGVFPQDAKAFSRFGREMVAAVAATDVLAVWFNSGEAAVVKRHAPSAKLVGLTSLEPHLWEDPWMSLLGEKRLLAITPFASTIRAQDSQRAAIWRARPEMNVDYELVTIQTPLAATLAPSPYPDWGTGLDDLRRQMDALEYDVAVIGAGAWSLPLAAHAKAQGRVGVHLGGGAQLVFGVKGKRWEAIPSHARYFNDAWVRPQGTERPDTVGKIENGCYW